MKIWVEIYHYFIMIDKIGIDKDRYLKLLSMKKFKYCHDYFLYSKILKRALIKIWYSKCYKLECLSKHINLQNSYSLPLNIQPNIVNLFRYFKRKNHRQNFCVLCVCQSIRIDLHHFWWIIPPKKKSGEKERICYYVWNSHYSISILLGCVFATLVWHFSSSFF